jgi:cell wall-associated NlpC family hydrolase
MVSAMSPRRWLAGLEMAAAFWLLAACATQGPVPSVAGTAATPPRSVPSNPASGAAGDLVIAAMTFLDRPYQAGGNSAETGFDCSGFTRYVFVQALGIELPRNTQEQANAPMLRPVSSRDALLAGDLVFFNTQHRAFSHVGIYLGDGRFIHAPRTGAQIRTESMASTYWSRRYSGARRAIAIDANP